jgi:DNA-nicking Smr family endonuclease
LARGHLHPDGRLDLHGMTQDHAFSALSRFLQHQRARGARLVLIITGKGRADYGTAPVLSEERGILRRLLPLWLQRPEFAGLIAGISQAHPRHGGDGAFYVHLRRAKE